MAQSLTMPRLFTFALCLCIASCGGEPPPVESPDNGEHEPAPAGPEQDCIDSANPGTALPGDAPTRISVQHLVVKHVDSKRVSDDIKRTRGAACLRAKEALDKLKGGAEPTDVIAEYSDEAGAASRGGSLADIKADDVDPRFAAAAFALDIGQVSYVVESESGFHVILRTD